MSDASSPDELAVLEALIQDWVDIQLADNPIVAAIDHDPAERRWYVRVLGEDKDTYTVWFTLGQRTLHYETFVMPEPDENHAEFYGHLLKRNQKLYGLAFSVGAENAVFLAGQMGNQAITDEELDRVLGTIYATVELCFRAALRIGFASRFAGPNAH
jgi:hypothetical protein